MNFTRDVGLLFVLLGIFLITFPFSVSAWYTLDTVYMRLFYIYIEVKQKYQTERNMKTMNQRHYMADWTSRDKGVADFSTYRCISYCCFFFDIVYCLNTSFNVVFFIFGY